MHWKYSVEPLLDAAHWTAIVSAGMLAVMFLTWSLAVTASQSGVLNNDDDVAGEILRFRYLDDIEVVTLAAELAAKEQKSTSPSDDARSINN
jgi:hypothetical protein